MLSRGAIGVMIVIRPAKAELVLPRLLHLRRAISPLPVFALGGEEEIARQIATEICDGVVDQLVNAREAVVFVFEIALAKTKALQVLEPRDRVRRRLARASASAVAFDDDQRSSILI